MTRDELVERCVCGGEIHAARRKDVPEAVRVHNQTAEHVLWRAMTGKISPDHVADIDILREMVNTRPSTYRHGDDL